MAQSKDSKGGALAGAGTGATFGATAGSAFGPVGTAVGGAAGGILGGAYGYMKGQNGVFGSSKNKAYSLLNKGQKGYMDSSLGALQRYNPGVLATLNDSALNGYNPYDAAQGQEVFDNARNEVEYDRQRQIDAVKGGPLNRFSLASGAMNTGINTGARQNVNILDMQQPGMETDANQQSFGNSQASIAQMLGLGQNLTGISSIQNKDKVKMGLAQKLGMISGTASSAKGLFK